MDIYYSYIGTTQCLLRLIMDYAYKGLHVMFQIIVSNIIVLYFFGIYTHAW